MLILMIYFMKLLLGNMRFISKSIYVVPIRDQKTNLYLPSSVCSITIGQIVEKQK